MLEFLCYDVKTVQSIIRLVGRFLEWVDVDLWTCVILGYTYQGRPVYLEIEDNTLSWVDSKGKLRTESRIHNPVAMRQLNSHTMKLICEDKVEWLISKLDSGTLLDLSHADCLMRLGEPGEVEKYLD